LYKILKEDFMPKKAVEKKKVAYKALSLIDGKVNEPLTKQINDAVKGKTIIGIIGGNIIVR